MGGKRMDMSEIWKVTGGGYEFAIVDDQGETMATVPFDQSPVDKSLDYPEGRRAVLLAAAPDMLAALEAYDTYFDGDEGEVHYNCKCDNCVTARRIIAKGRAAIAKARGTVQA
jgi:hypothetical protein